MSDVHGRKRVKDPEESIKARREKEASKITEYRDLVQQCHEKMNAKEYTQETLAVITQILRSNPDYYTIWNMRRIVLLEGILPLQESEDQRRKIFLNELDLFMQLIRINPKSYWLWNHRSWCLETMPKPNWTGELELVSKMLSLDARNFHGWGYRRYVVAQLRASADEAETAQISQREFEFTTQKINQNFSNYSAWHQRSKTLPEIVEKMSTEERNAVAQNELDIIKAAVYTDPDDQSAWLYYWWLIGRAPERVHLLGAYCLKKTQHVLVAFDDVVKFIKAPVVLDLHQRAINGQWHPFDFSDQGSIWLFVPTETDQQPSVIHSMAGSVLSSDGSKIATDTEWSTEIISLKEAPDWTVDRCKQCQRHKWQPAVVFVDPIALNQKTWFDLDRVALLKDEINAVRELIELEPNSRWALQTLAHFLQQLKLYMDDAESSEALDTETIAIFEKLMTLDSYRSNRYKEHKNRIMFHRATKNLLNGDGHKLKTDWVESLDLSNLITYDIAVPSILLFVRHLRVQTGSQQQSDALLRRLPFLEGCSSP